MIILLGRFCQDQGSCFIVDRKEHQIRTAVDGLLYLRAEIGLGILGKRGIAHDVEPACGSLTLEGIVDTGGISIRAVVNDRDTGRRQSVFVDVLCGLLALVRVGEADLIYIVIVIDHVLGGSGGGDLEHMIRSGLALDCQTRCGRHGTEQDLHTPVLQGIICIDCLFRIVGIILETVLHLIAVDAARGVDLIHRDLCRIHNG